MIHNTMYTKLRSERICRKEALHKFEHGFTFFFNNMLSHRKTKKQTKEQDKTSKSHAITIHKKYPFYSKLLVF